MTIATIEAAPRRGRGLLSGVALLPMLIMAAPVSAQEGGEAVGAADRIEDIVVTAQRREERLQDVPVAVTAVTGAALERQGITDTRMLTASVPALDYTQQNNGALVYLRGVGTSNGGMGQETSVAIYVDGVYLSVPAGSLFSFNNIARVEVLKGPQGTLFGRNATGGVIQVVTLDPSQATKFNAKVGYGNYDTWEASAYATTGLGDGLAADIAVYARDQRDGWGRNLTLNTDAFDHQNDISIRTKWLWNPGDRTEVRLIGDYSRSRSETGVAWNILPGTRGVDGVTTNPGFYNVTHNFPSASVVEQAGVTLSINHDMDWASLVSISSYRWLDGRFTLDQDATPRRQVDATVDQHATTFSQELQLVSPQAGALRWILGVYFNRDKPEFNPLRVEGLATGAFPFIDINSYQLSHSYAGFGQATLEIADKTHATAGLRYTRDERHVVGTRIAAPSTVLADVNKRANFEKLTWRFALDHEVAADVMVYASYNRGFKSGTFNLSSLPDPAVKPEVLDAYEIGYKTELAGKRLRLNGSFFYYDYKNIQTSQVLATGGQRIVNAPGATIKGFDIDLTAVPFKGLTIQGGLGYTHGRYKDFPNAPFFTPSANGAVQSTVNAKGNKTVHTPEITVNASVAYSHETSLGFLDFAVSYAYNDGFFWYPDNVTTQPSYHLVNGSVGWKSLDERYSLTLWSKNLAKERYYSFVSESALGFAGSPAAPRTYGVTFGVKY
ncbi:TonB-dependent receptor [Sphingomonas sp. YL-JM2C]